MLVTIAVAVMLALCALGMLSMIVGGGRGAAGMGDGAHDEPRTRGKGLLDELKTERDRLARKALGEVQGWHR